MLIPIPLCLSMGHLFKGGKRAVIAFAAVLMASTVFLARSRGGMIALLLQLAMLAPPRCGKNGIIVSRLGC